MKQKILVTGSAGFIGSHLTEELVRAGYNVRAMTHYNFQNNWGWLETLPRDIMEEVEVIPSDVCDPYAVDKAVRGVEIVFHLAALIGIPYSYKAPASYVATNVLGTLNVLQASIDHDVSKVVHTSTSETYGTAKYLPIDENHLLVAQSPYSATKIAADKLAESFYTSFDLPVAVIRPFNTFGPRQSARAVIPTISIQVLSDSKEVFLGSLSPVRDMSYVKDTVQGFITVAESDKTIGQVINIGRGKGVTVNELASMILEICDSDARIVTRKERVRPDKSEVMELVCDNSKARELIGWKPRYSLRQGLEETVEWIERNLNLYKKIYNI